MSRYVSHRASSARAPAAKRAIAEFSDSLLSRTIELRAKAARYKRLAKILSDARSIAVAEACARELEAEADLLECKDAEPQSPAH